ncbi:MAG: hypothetical protein KJZ85_14505 [Rhodobacteraceae bacterium]|nr:hypothetical protein [Paracoccaceae bacterium]
MNVKRLVLISLAAAALAGCEVPEDKGLDRGIDSKHLSHLRAGIWVDPNGCDHWIIDDGVEGYLSERLDPYGRPVCSGIAPPTSVVGPFKDGSPIPDPL